MAEARSERSQPPLLCWHDDDSNHISIVLAGKKVWLAGYGVTTDTDFNIRKRNWLSRIPFIQGGKLVTQVVTSRSGGRLCSINPWIAGDDIDPRIGRANYFFTDGHRHKSGDLTVCTYSDVTFEEARYKTSTGHLGASIPIPYSAPISAHLGARSKVTFVLRGKVVTPTDPIVSLELLLTWENGQRNLLDEITRYSLGAVPEACIPWIHRSSPGGVALSMSDSRVAVGPNDDAAFEITISVDQPIRVIFAVRTSVAGVPGQIAISDVIPVRVFG